MSKPQIQTKFSAGADLCSSISLSLAPGMVAIVPTGYRYHVNDPGTVGLVRGRSGLAFKHNVRVFDGTIDTDYEGGEVKVLIENLGQQPYKINTGDRIAQLVIVRHETDDWFPVVERERDAQGFGSTSK